MVPLFLFLSLDETVGVHEKIGGAIQSHFVFTGYLFYAWVIFGIALFMCVGGLYFRLLWVLRYTFSALFVASAGLFASGALVVEMIGAAVDSGALRAFPLGQTWTQMIAYEEVLEMAGIILLIHTILRILELKEAPYR